jgi:periplasmic protein CpxP/Spy
MTEPTTASPDHEPRQPNKGRRHFWRGVLAGGAGAMLMSIGFSAFSHGHRFGGFFRAGGGDPRAMLERAEFASDWMLTKVGASDAQKEQVRAIVTRTVTAVAPLREQHLANRKAMLEALAAPTVDAAKLAELRGAELKLADQASQALLQGLTDASNVLSPDQRQKLIEMAQRHRHGGWHEHSGFRKPDAGGERPTRTS